MIDFEKPRSMPSLANKPHRDVSADDEFEFDEIALGTHAKGASSGRTAGRINDWFGGILVAITLLAAVPIASARPAYWMLWSAVLGILLAVYMVSLAITNPERPISSLKMKAVLLPALALPVFGLIQYFFGGPLALENLPGGLSTTVGTLAPHATLMAVVRLLGLFALFVLVHEVSTRASRVEAMAWGMLVGIFLHAIWALVALFFLDDVGFWGEKDYGMGAATGTFINRNSFANFLGMGLCIGVAMILKSGGKPHIRRSGRRMFLNEQTLETLSLWLLLGIIAAALLATQSRMGVVASFVGAMVVSYTILAKRDHNVLAAAARVSVVGVLAMGVAFGVFGKGVLERGLFSVNDSVNRIELYQQVIGMIADRPLFGTGLDTFQPAFELVHQPPVSAGLVWRFAHSSYLTLWSEVGIIAGTLPMIAVGIAGRRLVAIIRRRRTGYAVASAALGVIVLQALHSIVDFSLEIQANLMLFVVVIAMGLGQLRRNGEKA